MLSKINREKLLTLLYSMCYNFTCGDYYMMNGKFTTLGFERWLSDGTIGVPGKLNMYEVISLVSIAIEHLWRVLNHKDIIFSKILMPQVLYNSYKSDAKDEMNNLGFYLSINCEFLKEYSKSELEDNIFSMLDFLGDQFADRVMSSRAEKEGS
jgi:hypothetical protein